MLPNYVAIILAQSQQTGMTTTQIANLEGTLIKLFEIGHFEGTYLKQVYVRIKYIPVVRLPISKL